MRFLLLSWHYVKCLIINVYILSVLMLSAMLSIALILSVIMHRVNMLIVSILCDLSYLSTIMSNAINLSAVILNAMM
jgi:hypothetical protein